MFSNDLQMVGSPVGWGFDSVSRWTSCLFDEFARIPDALKHLVEVVFFPTLSVTGVLQLICEREKGARMQHRL